MNKVYLRKRHIQVEEGSEFGPIFSERLDLQIDQENEKNFLRHCGFSFRSQISGVANVEGHIAFTEEYFEGESGLTHSSGRITKDSMTNFRELQNLLDRLETLCKMTLFDVEILDDERVQAILSSNGFVALEKVEK